MIVSRETDVLLHGYAALVAKWNPRINLVSSASLGELRTRHIADCMQIVEHATPASGHWVDLGSGGGLPGIVIAASFQGPDLCVTMIESDQRKCAFLRTAIREMNLSNAVVQSRRIEDVEPLACDHISARALAPLPRLLGMAHRHLAPGGTAWLMKGRLWRQEIIEAKGEWRFDYDAIPSKTDPDAAILKITGVSHV